MMQLRGIARSIYKLEQLIEDSDCQTPTYNVHVLKARAAALKEQMARVTLYQVTEIDLE